MTDPLAEALQGLDQHDMEVAYIGFTTADLASELRAALAGRGVYLVTAKSLAGSLADFGEWYGDSYETHYMQGMDPRAEGEVKYLAFAAAILDALAADMAAAAPAEEPE